MSVPLYHLATALYRRGDRVLPGNWGRLVMGYGPAHSSFYKEYAWEQLRRSEFPDKPSRMEVAFVCESADCATKLGRTDAYLYLVELGDPETPTHRADFKWWDAVSAYRSFEGIEECIRRYWGGLEREPDSWELLVPGELVVRDRLTPLPDNGVH